MPFSRRFSRKAAKARREFINRINNAFAALRLCVRFIIWPQGHLDVAENPAYYLRHLLNQRNLRAPKTSTFCAFPFPIVNSHQNCLRMNIVGQIKPLVTDAIKDLYGVEITPEQLTVSNTKPEFEGDYTIVLFSLVKSLKKSPEALGKELGEKLLAMNASLFSSFNVIKGFLNLTVVDQYWWTFLQDNYGNPSFGKLADNEQKVIVEYSSPNTNKPLHLGHLRNNFLGWSVAEILKETGHTVFKTTILNDRGIHICKSMVAWQLFANGATPQSTGIKGDHFVGDYYVLFGNELKKQVEKVIHTTGIRFS